MAKLCLSSLSDDVNSNTFLQENTEDINNFEVMKNVNIGKIKSRRGRHKGPKKPFWNFSSNQSGNNGKKRKREIETEVHNKKVKIVDEERKAAIDQIKQENLTDLENTDICSTSSNNVETPRLRTPLTTLNQ